MQPGTEHLSPEQLAQFERANEIFADAELELDPLEVQRRLADGSILLVDIREQYEWDDGHIDGARHIEIERLGWNSPTLPTDQPIVFTCRLGVRAKLAAHAFRRVGYEAYNLTGGMAAWNALGLPMVPDGAAVAMH
jgi:rhodanese-related sulfurtransferase